MPLTDTNVVSTRNGDAQNNIHNPHRTSRRIAPQHNGDASNTRVFVEVKAKRILRIVHLNGSEQVATDMQVKLSKGLQNGNVPEAQTEETNPAGIPSSDKFNQQGGIEQRNGPVSQGRRNMAFHTDENDVWETDNWSHPPDKTTTRSEQKDTPERTSKAETPGAIDIEMDAADSGANRSDVRAAVHKRDQSLQSRHNSEEETNESLLFFIHGVGGSSDVWRHQLDYFSEKGYEIVCPDLIGHGFSTAPHNNKAYTFDEICVDLILLFDMFCKKNNTVIGHSYGCSFAAVLARQRHHKVQKMVLVSGGSPVPLAPQPGIFSMPSCFLGCIWPLLSRGFKK